MLTDSEAALNRQNGRRRSTPQGVDPTLLLGDQPAALITGEKRLAARAFTCSLVAADERGNSVRTSSIVVSSRLLPIYLERMLPIALETGFALEVAPMNANRWDVVRCAGDIERAHGIKFILVDKRTALVVGTDATARGPLRALAETIEADEREARR